ncbi:MULTISPECIES: MFS transporter [unclassified Fusibacter]|uniref:MFS transporter n=1 Tax=unclassified Fusibacter TaxID=2624464 RepID=UPI0013E96650|nr:MULTISPECIES: MFS transporter [unclassified Fusibacter]MCK8060714.1 MFS transporter [Fusibacter sp. A2]NPE22832.1 MFS transporter [Fusibacter sp. A1]
MILKKNIVKNYIYTFVSSVAVTDAIWMLFLAYRGMSLLEIGILESIFHISSLLMEIPTGIVADRFGRKTSRVMGRVLALVGTALMLSSHSFWMFAVAFVFSSLSYNMESGAGDALVYDTLVEIGESNRYMKIKGIIELCFQTAKTSSLIIGGWIATFNYELGYGISILINVLAIISALSFKEPTVHQTDQKKVSMLGHIKGSIGVIRDNAQILDYVVFIESFSLFHTTLFFYFQNFLKGKGFSETWIGVTLASASLLSILFSTRAHWFEEKFGRYRIIRTSAVATLIALAGIAFLPMEIAFFIMISCIDGVLFVAFSDYINQLIPSEHRATLLSFQAMVFSLLMILYFPVFGWVASSFGFKAGFIMVFFTSVPLMGFTFLRLKNTIRDTEKEKEV